MEKRSEACDGKERRTVMKRVEETKSLASGRERESGRFFLRVVPASRVKKRCSRRPHLAPAVCFCVCECARRDGEEHSSVRLSWREREKAPISLFLLVTHRFESTGVCRSWFPISNFLQKRRWVVSPPLPGRSAQLSLVDQSRPLPRSLSIVLGSPSPLPLTPHRTWEAWSSLS